jgi:hypothetical protein
MVFIFHETVKDCKEHYGKSCGILCIRHSDKAIALNALSPLGQMLSKRAGGEVWLVVILQIGVEFFSAVAAEPNSRFRAIVGFSAVADNSSQGRGGVAAVDLATGRLSGRVHRSFPLETVQNICHMLFH